MPQRVAVGLHRFAVVTAAATLALLFAGGLVTSTGSGLAVPDWPLSFGQVFPTMEGGVLFEHGHRLVASGVGLLTLALALWLVVREPRPAVRALGLLALFAVVVQGVLGGVTVLYKLPLAVSVSHACLAQIFFCLTVVLAVVTGPGWLAPQTVVESDARPSLRALAIATTAVVFVQIVLGALVRHLGAGLAIYEFPFPLFPPLVTTERTVHFAHRVGAVAVTVLVAWMVARVLRRHRDVPQLRRLALLATGLLGLQVALGAVIIWRWRPLVPTTAHLVVGAALLATCLVTALRAGRLVRVTTTVPRGVRLERAVA